MTCAKNASTWIHAAAATWRNAGRPRGTRRPHYGVTRVEASPYGIDALAVGDCPIAERPLPGREGPRPSAVSSYSTRGGTVGNTFLVQKPSRSRMRSVVVSIFCEMLSIALRREAADSGRYRRLEPRHPSARPAATDICGDRRHGRCVPRTPPLLSHVLCPPFPAALEKSYRAIIQLQCGGSDAPSECSRCRGNRCPWCPCRIGCSSARAGAGDWRHGVRRRAAHRGRRKRPDRERDAGRGRHEDRTGRQGRRRSRARGRHAREPGRQDRHADA